MACVPWQNLNERGENKAKIHELTRLPLLHSCLGRPRSPVQELHKSNSAVGKTCHTVDKWVRWNLSRKGSQYFLPWKETFATCLWLMWKWRNNDGFNGGRGNLSEEIPTYTYTSEFLATFLKQGTLDSNCKEKDAVDGMDRMDHSTPRMAEM